MPMSDPSRINAAWNGREAQDYERSRLVVPLEDALAVERELTAAQQENERLREALREAARGFGLAYVTAAKDLHDETLLHCGHHEAAARRALSNEGE